MFLDPFKRLRWTLCCLVLAGLTISLQTAEPLPNRETAAGLKDLASQEMRPASGQGDWSEVEGKVTFVGRSAESIIVEITSGAGRITAIIPDQPGVPLSMLPDSWVRARGVLEMAYTLDGFRLPSRLDAREAEQLELLDVAAKHWTAARSTTIAGARASGAAARQLIKIRGAAMTLEGPRTLRVRDDTGQIPVQLARPLDEAPDGVIELLGDWNATATNATLSNAVWRETPGGEGSDPQGLPLLRTTEEVHSLDPDQAKAEYPVRIRGVVTSRDPDGGMVQDGTRGVYVYGLKSDDPSWPEAGDYVEVEGLTVPGSFAPMIHSTTVRRLGRARMPDPVRPTWERLNNGSMDCQYVEIEGIVTEAYSDTLVLLMPEGHFGIAIVPQPGVDANDYALPRYIDKHARIRGTVFATRDNETRRVRSGSIGLGNAVIGLGDPVITLDKQIRELMQFDARAAGFHRVRVSGQVLHARGQDHYLSDGTNGLRFVAKAPANLAAGDLVEVVGFPRLDGPAPVLLEAKARKLGHDQLPAGRPVPPESLSNAAHAGARVVLDALLLGVRSNRTDLMLDLQAGSRNLTARLDSRHGEVLSLPIGSRLRLTGVYPGQGRDRITGVETDASELLLNSAEDIEVLERPSWWTPRRALTVISSLMGALALGAVWVVSLRGQVETRTGELKEEIEQRKRVQAEIEQVHMKLVDASRKAGMAQIATGVLHNVGNVLNSVNVSANILTENARNSRISTLSQLADLLEQSAEDLANFLGSDPRGQRIPTFLRNLSGHFQKEQSQQLQELDELRKHIEHIKETVAMQQFYAKTSSTVYEPVSLIEVVEDALRLHEAAFVRHEITVIREFTPLPPFYLDRHKTLQILVNLLSNAKDACDEKKTGERRIVARVIAPSSESVKIEIEDSGAGIAPENLHKIFHYGFTTRTRGHGYGLHSSANAAAEMKSSLTARSDGLEKGATFILTIPRRQSAETQSVEPAENSEPIFL